MRYNYAKWLEARGWSRVPFEYQRWFHPNHKSEGSIFNIDWGYTLKDALVRAGFGIRR